MNRKILLIDDDDSLTELLRERLCGEGYDVIVAPDGAMGTQLAHKAHPDLILLDLHLPAGGGLAVLRNLRQSLDTRAIPFLILTGSSDPKVKAKLLEFGIHTYLQKPFRSDELIAEMKKVLPSGNNPGSSKQ